MLQFGKKKRGAGFTLIELLVAIAIVSVLAAVALPAYNNYAIKSRFTEVVSATNPLKTYVASCAADGSCVQNNQIYFDLSSPSVQVSAAVPDQLNIPASEQPMYMLIYTAYQNAAAAGYTMATDFATAWANAQELLSEGEYSVGTDPDNSANTCLLNTAYSQAYRQVVTSCVSYATTTQTMESQYGAADNVTFPTSMAPSAVISYASVDGASAAVVTPAHTGTAVIPCQSSSDASCFPSTKYVATAYASSTGVITATAQTSYSLAANTFILIPSYSSGRVDWTESGTCKTRQGGALC